MSIIGNNPKPEKDFTMIRNEALRDPRLTFKATGLLAFILSHDPKTFTISKATLYAAKRDGKASVESALKELEKAGYLKKEAIRSGGKIVEHRITVIGIAKAFPPDPDFQDLENQDQGNQPHKNTNQLSKLINKEKKEDASLFFGNESDQAKQGSDRPSELSKQEANNLKKAEKVLTQTSQATSLSLADKGQVNDAEESFPSSSGIKPTSQKNIDSRVLGNSSRTNVIDPMKARMEANKKAAMLSKSKNQYYDGELKAICDFGLKEELIPDFCRWYHRNITQNNSSYRQDAYDFQTTRKRAFKGKWGNDDLLDLQVNISRYLAQKSKVQETKAPSQDVSKKETKVNLEMAEKIKEKIRKNAEARRRKTS